MNQPKRPPLKLVGQKEGRPELNLITELDEKKNSTTEPSNGLETSGMPLPTSQENEITYGTIPLQDVNVSAQRVNPLMGNTLQQYIPEERQQELVDGVNSGGGIPLTESQKQGVQAFQANNPDVGILGQPIGRDEIRQTTKEEIAHNKFMDSTVGKVLGNIAYVGSKASKGVIDIAKGANGLLKDFAKATGDFEDILPEYEQATDKGFKAVEDATQYGLTKGDVGRVEDNGMMGKIMQNIGGVSEFAPTGAISKAMRIPQFATFFLQSLGAAKDETAKLREEGKALDPNVEKAYEYANGAIGGLLFGELSQSIFGKMPSGLRKDIISSLSADIIKQGVEKKLTGAEVQALLKEGINSLGTKSAQALYKMAEGGVHAMKSLGTLNVGTYAIKEGADALNSKEVFDQKLGDLTDNLMHTVGTAAMFGIGGGIGALSKLTKYSNYKNQVVEGLMNNPSAENLVKMKQDVVDVGRQQGWSDKEIESTTNHIDNIGAIAYKLKATEEAIGGKIPKEKLVDAVDLVNGRTELQEQLKTIKEAEKNADESIDGIENPNKKYLEDKIDQANDKLSDIITGKETTYFYDKATDAYSKLKNGKLTDIDKSRYDLEQKEKPYVEADKKDSTAPTEGEVSLKQPKIGDTVGYNLNNESFTGTLKEIKENGDYVVEKADGTLYTTNALENVKTNGKESTPTPPIENVETPPAPADYNIVTETVKPEVKPAEVKKEPVSKPEDKTNEELLGELESSLDALKVKPTTDSKSDEKATIEDLIQLNDVHKNLSEQYLKKHNELIKKGLRGEELKNNPELVELKTNMDKIEKEFKKPTIKEIAKESPNVIIGKIPKTEGKPKVSEVPAEKVENNTDNKVYEVKTEYKGDTTKEAIDDFSKWTKNRKNSYEGQTDEAIDKDGVEVKSFGTINNRGLDFQKDLSNVEISQQEIEERGDTRGTVSLNRHNPLTRETQNADGSRTINVINPITDYVGRSGVLDIDFRLPRYSNVKAEEIAKIIKDAVSNREPGDTQTIKNGIDKVKELIKKSKEEANKKNITKEPYKGNLDVEQQARKKELLDKMLGSDLTAKEQSEFTELTNIEKGITDAKSQQPLVEQAKTDVGSEKPTDVSKEAQPIVETTKEEKLFTVKSGKQTVIAKKGYLEIKNIDGTEPSAPTRKKAEREYADSLDFTVGEKSKPTPDNITSEESALSHAIETSNNPSEIASIYASQPKKASNLSYKEESMAEYGLEGIKRSSYAMFGDVNGINNSMARSYFSGNRKSSIDVIAQELSDIYKVEFTPQDIVDFINRFPNGSQSALKQVESSISLEAKSKFSDLTGVRLTKEVAEKAINQEFDKLDKQKQKFIENEYESAKQLEEDYWRVYKETNGFTKESNTNKAIEPTPTTEKSVKIVEIENRQEEIRKRISEKLKQQRSNLNSGIDPSLLKDFIELGATYIEKGIVKTADLIKAFREDYKKWGLNDKDITDAEIADKVFGIKENVVEVADKPKVESNFDKKLNENIKEDALSQSLSNIDRESKFGLSEEEKAYNKVIQEKALKHGQDIIESAKEEFGNDYVDKVIDYVENNKMPSDTKALTLISLENEIYKKILDEPQNEHRLLVQLKKAEQASKKALEENARGNAYGALRTKGRVGYDVQQTADSLFNENKKKQKESAKKIVNVTPEDIAKEAEAQEQAKIDKKEGNIVDFSDVDVNAKQTDKTKAKILADKIRSLKSNQSYRKNAGANNIGAVLDFFRDGALETIATSVEAGDSIIQGIKKAVNKIQDEQKKRKDEVTDTKELFNALKDDILGESKKTQSPEQKRKTYITKLKNDITSLEEQIDAGERKVITKEDKYAHDEEIKTLREERDAKKAELDVVDPTYKEQVKLKQDLATAEKSLKEYQRKIDENEFTASEDSSTKTVVKKLQDLRDARDKVKDEYNEKKKSYEESLITPEELAQAEIDKEIKKTENAISNLEDKLNGKTVTPKETSIWTKEIGELKQKQEQLKQELKDKRDALKEPLTPEELYEKRLDDKLKATQKSIEKLIENKPKDISGDSPWNQELSDLKKKEKLLRDDIKKSKEKTAQEFLEQAKENIKKRIQEAKDNIENKLTELKTRRKNFKGDAEYNGLKKELEHLTALAKEFLSPESKALLSERSKDVVVKRLEGDIEALDAQIAKGEKDAYEAKKDPLESDRINDLKAQKKARIQILEQIDPSAKQAVKDALVEAGFGKEITVNTKNGKEKRTILDWNSLLTESVYSLREKVEQSLKGKGFTDGQISRMKAELEAEYNRLIEGSIEKGLTELNRRNTPNSGGNQKTLARRIAELYNKGLFNENSDTYDYLINQTFGTSFKDQQLFFKIKDLAKALSIAHNFESNDVKLSDLGMSTLSSDIKAQIKDVMQLAVARQASSEGGFKGYVFLASEIAKQFLAMSQRQLLVTLKQLIENPFSGLRNDFHVKVQDLFKKEKWDTAELAQGRKLMSGIIYANTSLHGGSEYGGTANAFTTKNSIEHWVSQRSKSELYQAFINIGSGKPFLDSADSAFKIKRTELEFTHNLLRILTDKTNKNHMEHDEALAYISESMNEQSRADAFNVATEVVNEINNKLGKKIVSTRETYIKRLANDIMKDGLVKGGKISAEEVLSAFNAGFTTAGHGMGHEANNMLSDQVGALNRTIQTKLDKAIKNGEWDKATANNLGLIVSRIVLNPFVGGGSNWAMLGLQASGIPTQYIRGRGNVTIDLATPTGMNKLQETLTNIGVRQRSNGRWLIGMSVQAVAFGLSYGLISKDDKDKINEWKNKHPNATKYSRVITPLSVQLYLAKDDKEWVKSLLSAVGSRYGYDDDGTRLIKNSILLYKAIANNDENSRAKALGVLGEMSGSKTNIPYIPSRLFINALDLGRDVKKYSPSMGLWNGYTRNGVTDMFGLRDEGGKYDILMDLDEPSRNILKNKDYDLKSKDWGTVKIPDIKNGIERVATKEEYVKYKEEYNAYISDYLKAKGEDLKGLSKEKFDYEMSIVKKVATAYSNIKVLKRYGNILTYKRDGIENTITKEQAEQIMNQYTSRMSRKGDMSGKTISLAIKDNLPRDIAKKIVYIKESSSEFIKAKKGVLKIKGEQEEE